MNRRTVIAGFLLPAFSVLAGCLSRSEGGESDDEIRQKACSHVPAEADHAEHDVTQTEFHFLRDDYAPLTLVTTDDQIESRVDSEQREHGDVDALFEDVNFDEQAILLWEATENITMDNVEFLDVTQPDDDTLRAYGCDYRLGSGGQESTSLSFIVTVDIDETPQRAELLVQNEDAETTTLTAE